MDELDPYDRPPFPPPYRGEVEEPSGAAAFAAAVIAGTLLVAAVVALTFVVAVTAWLCVWAWEVVW
jgi:hypothetical protein